MADHTQPEYVQRRVRFFDGQFLREQDFIDEQRYHLDRGRRHARLTCSPGVLDGLGVAPVANAAKVTVAAGTALDGRGRQLVRAASDTPLDLTGHVNRDGPVPVVVTITYREVEDGALPGGGSPRWLEDPELVAFPEGASDAPPPETHVRLARVLVQPGGTAEVDPAFRPTLGGLDMGGGLRVGGTGEFDDGIRGGSGPDGGPAPLRVDGALRVHGPRDFDGTTRLDLVNGSTDFGRTNLVLTGRFQDGNDGWNFGSFARTSVVFARNTARSGQAVGEVGEEQHSLQLEGNPNTLGFLTRERGDDPALVITQGGSVGVGTPDPDPVARLDVDGDLVVRDSLLTGRIGRWSAAVIGTVTSITIEPGSDHNVIVLKRRLGVIGIVQIHIPAGTEQQWFGRYTCYDPQSHVMGDQLPILDGVPMTAIGGNVTMLGGAQPVVLVAELHRITVVDV
jgi:hypothetical protein